MGVFLWLYFIGDRVVVASTDYDWRQAEERTLRQCDECTSNQVQLDCKFNQRKRDSVAKQRNTSKYNIRM